MGILNMGSGGCIKQLRGHLKHRFVWRVVGICYGDHKSCGLVDYG